MRNSEPKLFKPKKILIVKSKTNYNELAKQYFYLMSDDVNVSSIQVKRYILCDIISNDVLGTGELVKKYKNKGLYLAKFAIKLDTLGYVLEWIAKSPDNTRTIIKNYDNN